MKRIITVQDISCLGKCSLTVALPLLSCFNLETCIVPTAVLSTHTMFKNFTVRDLSSDLIPIKNHWKSEGFLFDALYTGYLGSEKQIDDVIEYHKAFNKEGFITVIDPVMADNGKLYPAFDINYAKHNAELLKIADVVIPNITEASILTDFPYISEGYDEKYIKDMLLKLVSMGSKSAMITGVSFSPDKIGVMGYDGIKKEFFSYYNKKIDAQYHGTGDIFSSVFTGGLLRNYGYLKSAKFAADFTAKCIEITKNGKNSIKYGVYFEELLPYLIKEIEKNG